MASLSEWFEKQERYKPKWEYGSRVFGYWNKIPFVGTVGNDTLISNLEGPRISIHLDLPINFEKKIHHVIIVTHKDITALVEY